MICDPDVEEFEINASTSFLIIASDGLWDVCEDQVPCNLSAESSGSREEMCDSGVDVQNSGGLLPEERFEGQY